MVPFSRNRAHSQTHRQTHYFIIGIDRYTVEQVIYASESSIFDYLFLLIDFVKKTVEFQFSVDWQEIRISSLIRS